MFKDSHYSTLYKRKMTTMVVNSHVVLKWYSTIINLIDSWKTEREREREREREEEEEEEITYSNSMYVSLWMPCKVDDLLLDNTILSYIDDWVVEFVLCVK